MINTINHYSNQNIKRNNTAFGKTVQKTLSGEVVKDNSLRQLIKTIKGDKVEKKKPSRNELRAKDATSSGIDLLIENLADFIFDTPGKIKSMTKIFHKKNK